MLRLETAKAVARVVVSALFYDPVGVFEGFAALSKIYLTSVEASARKHLTHVVTVEFGNISEADVLAIDASVRTAIETSRIDPVDAAARPKVVFDRLLAGRASIERAALRSEDLANLFDRFLMTAILEIGQAARLLPSLPLDGALRALRESADTSARLGTIEEDLSREIDSLKERIGRAHPSVPVDLVVQAHRRSLDDYLPEVVDPRRLEVSQALTFLAGRREQWFGWRGEAWCGKSTLMAMILQEVEPESEVVPFFISSREIGSRRRDDFLARTLPRLAQLCGEEAMPQTPTGLEVDLYRAYLHRAAERCASDGKRLVYLIDGLDEDAGTDSGSILAVLPTTLPENVCAIVSARPVPLPRDIPPHHPLRRTEPWHVLQPSDLAKAARATAEDDVSQLLASPTGRSVAEALAAAAAPLTAADLAELTGTPAARLSIELLARREGRCLAVAVIPPIDPRDIGPSETGYRLAHEEVLREVVLSLRPQAARAETPAAWQTAADEALAPGRERVMAWADAWQNRGWPSDTPRYLIREYGALLASHEQYGRLLALGQSPRRQALLDKAWGVPWRAQQELINTVASLARRDPPDLEGIANLRIMLDIRAPNSGSLDPKVPEAWAWLGRHEYADYLCDQTSDLDQEEAVARLLRLALHDGDTTRAQQLAQLLGYDSPTVLRVLSAVDEELSGERLLERVRPSDELSADEEWDSRPELAHVDQLLEQELRYRREYEDGPVGWSPEEGAIFDDAEEGLTAKLLLAAEAGEEGVVSELAGRLDWSRAAWGAPGRITQDGRAMARVIVRLGAWRPVLSVLRTRLSYRAEDELTTDAAIRAFSRTEDAAVMMVHLAIALRRAGSRAEADGIAAEIPGNYWAEQYWARAAIDAAGDGDGLLAVDYLSHITSPLALAEALASAALLLAWAGAPAALATTKAAESAGHVLDADSYAVRKLQLLAAAVTDGDESQLQWDLLVTSGRLIEGVENPNIKHRQLHRLAALLCSAWTRIDGDLALATIDIGYVTWMVHTRLAVEAIETESYGDAIRHLQWITDGDAQARAAAALVQYGSEASVATLQRGDVLGPPWLAPALDRAREDHATDAEAEAERQAMMKVWPSSTATAALAVAWREVERLNDGTATPAARLIRSIRDVTNDAMGVDDYASMRELIALAGRVPAIDAILTGLLLSEDDYAVRSLAPDLVRRCFELDDETAARRLVDSLEDDDQRDAGVKALFDCFREAEDASSAEWCVEEMRSDYDRANAYRDLALDALRNGRRGAVERYKAGVASSNARVLREICQAEVEDAMSRSEVVSAQHLVAADMAMYEIDEMTVSMLATVAPQALLAASRRAVVEAEDLLSRLAGMRLIEQLKVELEAVAGLAR